MKVYLWEHKEGFYLVNENFTMIAKPYFVTHPQRTNFLKERYTQTMSKNELLSLITNDELQILVNDCVIRWKSIIPVINGFHNNLIAIAEI